MKINLQKKIWLKILGGITLVSALLAPAAILVSCSDNINSDSNSNNGAGSNNGNNPDNGSTPGNGSKPDGSGDSDDSSSSNPNPIIPPAPDTSSIKTFNEAKKFAKKYLEANYNIELFNCDAKFWMNQYVNLYKNNIEGAGNTIDNFIYKFNAREENQKKFIDSELQIEGTNGNYWARETCNNSVQNAKIEPIFVLRDNVVHVEFAISYTFFQPTGIQSYESLEALKAANRNWDQKIIVHTVSDFVNNESSSNENYLIDRWEIIEEKSGSDYILRPTSDGFVNFSKNWTAFKISSLPIFFKNIQDINDHLSPV